MGLTYMNNHNHNLFTNAKILSYKRSKTNQYNKSVIVKLCGVESREETAFYLGKRVACPIKLSTSIRGSRSRYLWGTVTRPHGHSGAVRVNFVNNIPPNVLGSDCRVL